MNNGATIEDATRRPPKLKAMLWRRIGRTAFRCTPRTAYSTRRRLLGFFGADLARTVKFRNTCSIDEPWNLTVGALTMFGDSTIVRSASPIRVGQRCVISQYSLLMTSMIERDHDGRFHQTPRPIEIGDDCWVATDCLVLPGAKVPDGVVIGARSVIGGGLEPWTIATGAPAKSRRQRPPWREISKVEESADG